MRIPSVQEARVLRLGGVPLLCFIPARYQSSFVSDVHFPLTALEDESRLEREREGGERGCTL